MNYFLSNSSNVSLQLANQNNMNILLIHTPQRPFTDSGVGLKMLLHLRDASWPSRKNSEVDY